MYMYLQCTYVHKYTCTALYITYTCGIYGFVGVARTAVYLLYLSANYCISSCSNKTNSSLSREGFSTQPFVCLIGRFSRIVRERSIPYRMAAAAALGGAVHLRGRLKLLQLLSVLVVCCAPQGKQKL